MSNLGPSEQLKWISTLLTIVGMGIGAAWTTRTYADASAKEALVGIQKQFDRHESLGHTAHVRREEYMKDIDRIQDTLKSIDAKLDRLIQPHRQPR